jgi:dTDP-4-dehydrorhamnose reductase
MPKVLILGSTGMLGSAVEKVLRAGGLDITVASRTKGILFDAVDVNMWNLVEDSDLSSGDFIVNCMGLTKTRIDENSRASRELAVRLNIDFPNSLAKAAENSSLKVIQVATDCVYSGGGSSYTELDTHDAHDVYGKTKSLGETPSNSVMHLRCSLIGPELGKSSLFYEWVKNQPQGSHIQGYKNHVWNGLTSTAFAKIVHGVITSNHFKPGVQHLVPAGRVTKDELVRIALASLSRTDVEVEPVDAPIGADRTLSTISPELNEELFRSAGYVSVPDIPQMVKELSLELSK